MIQLILQMTSVLLVVAGVGVAVHYHLMASFMQRAPLWVKYVALPVSTFGGVGMIFCGITSSYLGGAMASAVAITSVVAINLAAWSNGAHVSVLFERQAQQRDLLKVKGLMREFRTGVEEVRDLLTDSGLQELAESERRAKERM